MDLLMMNCGNGSIKMNNHHGTASLKQTSTDSSRSDGLSDRMAKLEVQVAVILTKLGQMPTKDYLHSEINKLGESIDKKWWRYIRFFLLCVLVVFAVLNFFFK